MIRNPHLDIILWVSTLLLPGLACRPPNGPEAKRAARFHHFGKFGLTVGCCRPQKRPPPFEIPPFLDFNRRTTSSSGTAAHLVLQDTKTKRHSSACRERRLQDASAPFSSTACCALHVSSGVTKPPCGLHLFNDCDIDKSLGKTNSSDCITRETWTRKYPRRRWQNGS
jgi:hypothetical protein